MEGNDKPDSLSSCVSLCARECIKGKTEIERETKEAFKNLFLWPEENPALCQGADFKRCAYYSSNVLLVLMYQIERAEQAMACFFGLAEMNRQARDDGELYWP